MYDVDRDNWVFIYFCFSVTSDKLFGVGRIRGARCSAKHESIGTLNAVIIAVRILPGDPR